MKRNNFTRKELIDIYGVSEILKPDGYQEPRQNMQARGRQVAPSQKKNASKQIQVQAKRDMNKKISVSSWSELEVQMKDCKRCILADTRTNIVFGEGNKNAELMFIGEGPGAQEDETGRPFVGRAGKLLTDMITAMTLTRQEVYIANIVKCRPPRNRAPLKEEVEKCISFLHHQIDFIKPKIIVCLGATAVGHLLNPSQKISQIRGKFQEYRGIKIMPTFHPAYLLRNPARKREVWDDLQVVMAELGLERK